MTEQVPSRYVPEIVLMTDIERNVDTDSLSKKNVLYVYYVRTGSCIWPLHASAHKGVLCTHVAWQRQ